MFTLAKSKFILTALLVSSMALTACGGGGGSSTPNPAATARLTTDNATDFADIVELSYYTSATGYSLMGAKSDTQSENTHNVSSIQKATTILRNLAVNKVNNTNYQARTTTSTEACSDGGSVTVTGTIDDATSTGTVSITMDYCIEDGITMNGSSTVTITTNTSSQFIASITFNNLSVDDGYDALVLQGSQSINETATQVTITSNLIFTLNSTEQVEQKQLVVTENSSGVTASGALCITGQGCVTIETVTPIQLDIYGYPISGEIILHGVDSNLRILLVDGYAYLYLDANGDGTFETALSE